MTEPSLKSTDKNAKRVETKHERFVRLAEKRVNNALKMINLIGNLSNRNNYDYEKKDYLKIINALKKALAAVESRFDDSDNTEFRL
jgi:uncharacterized alpha/beta hydrolase family protein